MPRRRPGAVRAAQQRTAHVARIPGLSPSTCRALNRPDRDAVRPDAVGAALRLWRQVAASPVSCQYEPLSALGPELRYVVHRPIQPMCPVCDADGVVSNPRGVLRDAIHALPRRHARQLRGLVRRLDRRIRERTLPHPDRRPDEPWWSRRIIVG